MKGTNPTDLISLLEDSSEGLDDIKGTVQTLTNYSHAESADMQDININEAIKTAISLHSEIKGERGIACDFSKEYLLVKGLENQVVQVFANIVENAIQATKDDGTITIKTEAKNNGASIVISDDGNGIDSKMLSKVCDPFFTTKDVGEGTGLGLSIAQQIVILFTTFQI